MFKKEKTDKGWIWLLKADNHEVLAKTEPGQFFKTESACDIAIDTVALYAVKSGRAQNTADQIKNSKRKALFVWGQTDTTFPKCVAEHLGRKDLDIVSVEWLSSQQDWETVTYSEVIIDHGAHLNRSQSKAAKSIKTHSR